MKDKRVKYNCLENDNHFYMNFVDGKLDEFEIGDELEESWTVISFKDICEGLKKAGYEVQRL